MKARLTAVSVFTVLFGVTGSLLAEGEGPLPTGPLPTGPLPTGAERGNPRDAHREAVLREYDADGDGKLSATEARRALAAMRAIRDAAKAEQAREAGRAWQAQLQRAAEYNRELERRYGGRQGWTEGERMTPRPAGQFERREGDGKRSERR